MKLSAILSLLTITFVQKALSTHLEPCSCDQIRELVNTTIREAVARLEDRLTLMIDPAVNTTDSSLVDDLNHFFPSPENTPPPAMENSEDSPASSCKDLFNENSDVVSGHYWIRKSGSSPVRMNISTCGQQTGGWMRVANLDMRNTSHTCPSGLSLISAPKRLCDVTRDRTRSGQCVSNTLNTQGVEYSHVCGKIIGYQNKIPTAFSYTTGIGGVYVSGVSLTHGRSPRKHIWTFAGGSDESDRTPAHTQCPCIRTVTTSTVPCYVGSDYFCDTGLVYYRTVPPALQTADPLWDGQGCGDNSACCSFNSPPWFVKDLPSPTTDNVDMRVCRSRGSTPIETVDIYVQ